MLAPVRSSMRLVIPAVVLLALPAFADGLGPGGYKALVYLFGALALGAAMLVAGLIAGLIWLVRRRRAGR